MKKNAKKQIIMPPPKMSLEDGDYYRLPDGRMVFTEQYHLKRGYCCKSVNGCKHCPYKDKEK